MRATVFVTLFAALAAGSCARRVQPAVATTAPAAAVPEAPAGPPTQPPSATLAPALTEEDVFARMTLEELNASRPLADVFFDLDRFSIGNEGGAALQRNAAWLWRWPSTHIALEGHAGSLGTTEYNLALGDQRAQAIRDCLTSLGLGADRLRVLSKGEEAPLCTGEHEECWRQNRRGHFVITAK